MPGNVKVTSDSKGEEEMPSLSSTAEQSCAMLLSRVNNCCSITKETKRKHRQGMNGWTFSQHLCKEKATTATPTSRYFQTKCNISLYRPQGGCLLWGLSYVSATDANRGDPFSTWWLEQESDKVWVVQHQNWHKWASPYPLKAWIFFHWFNVILDPFFSRSWKLQHQILPWTRIADG